VSANLTLSSIYDPAFIALGSLMTVSGVLLLLSASFVLVGALKLSGPFTLFHIWEPLDLQEHVSVNQYFSFRMSID